VGIDTRTCVLEVRHMGPVVIAIAVFLCSAYLLWQVWEADLADDQ
jgi:hypothetical protein